ncbi:cell division protein FtsQ/DivIB [Hydrocarboniphaga sp.]|uniref:cell division protein FtsQ/DivIB n=1 Tax=Hydrocarboniphaga sp. TaxID=2033016 RepID=UPI003D0FFFC4
MPATTFDRGARALPLPSAATINLRLPRWLPGLGLAILAIGLLILALQWRQPMLSRLQIEGHFDRVSPESVRAVTAAHLAQGFFSVDLAAIRNDVAALPWVSRARVERVWPTGVRVRVWERQAYARWNADSLLDTDSVAFTPAVGDLPEAVVAKLPRLAGTAGNEKLVIDTYRVMSQALAETPLALSGLQLDARGEWTAQTLRGIELRLGPGTAADKLTVLLGALPASLGERLADVAYVDLRYTNGFAIGWISRAATGKNATDGKAGAKAAAPATLGDNKDG